MCLLVSVGLAGDYVDRGSWGLETLLLFLTYKWLLPNNVYLLRGWVQSQKDTAHSTTRHRPGSCLLRCACMPGSAFKHTSKLKLSA